MFAYEASILKQALVLGYLNFIRYFKLDRVIEAITDAPVGLQLYPVQVLLDI